MGVEVIEKFGFWRVETEAHAGEFVVDEARIETGDQGAGHGCYEDHDGKTGDGAAEEGEFGFLEVIEFFEGYFRVGQEAVLAQDGQSVPEHGGIAEECGAEMSCEAVLGDAWVGTRFKEIVLQSRFHHPPSDEALESNQACDAAETERHALGNPSTRDEVDCGNHEREPDEAAPKSMDPFHVVDVLEFGERHVRVQLFEFRRSAVLGEFGFPIFVRHRW